MKNSKTFTPEKFVASYWVDITHDGLRLDNFLVKAFRTLSREFLIKKIKRGDVSIEGLHHRLRPATLVKEGYKVTMETKAIEDDCEEWNGEKIIPHFSKDLILYSDDDFVVVDKPPFVTTHPTGRKLFSCMSVFLDAQLGGKHYSVHRLDRETSGVMVFAKNKAMASYFTRLFEERRVKKTYFLVGHKRKDYTFPSLLSNRRAFKMEMGDKKRVFIEALSEESNEGKSAHTDFALLSEKNGFLYALAFPKTGRQHQIRVHASSSGFPLVGDKIYTWGQDVFVRFKEDKVLEEDIQKLIIPRHALHAFELAFPDQKGEWRSFRAKTLPCDIMKVITEEMGETSEEVFQRIESFQRSKNPFNL